MGGASGKKVKKWRWNRRCKGYQLVYTNGVNAFFVRRELVRNADDFHFDRLFI